MTKIQITQVMFLGTITFRIYIDSENFCFVSFKEYNEFNSIIKSKSKALLHINSRSTFIRNCVKLILKGEQIQLIHD